MLKKKRSLLEMSENELEAVIKVISPGLILRKHSKSDLQEEVIHWLLGNGLRVNHEFTLIEMDNSSYGVLTDKDGCSCCQRSVQFGTNQRVEKIVKKTAKNNLSSEMVRSIVVEETSEIKSEANHDSKQAIIGMQPLPTSLSLSDTITKIDEGCRINPEKRTEQQKGGFSQCCAELGGCCISLLSSC